MSCATELIVAKMSLELNLDGKYNAVMDFKTFIGEEAKTVEEGLTDYLIQKKTKLTKINPLLNPLFSLVINTNKGGKRLRGLLVKLGYLIAGGENEKAIIAPMMAVEIFHSAILAHDDIIDQSELRRGIPTMHHAMGNDHHALSQTIVLADYGLFLANKLLLESDFEAEKKNEAAKVFTNTILDTIVGEILDVEIPFKKLDPLQKDALTISLFKTARYTITGPLQIGFILGGGDKKLLNDLQTVGDSIGIAFQIQDDILGVFGDSEEMGKSNLSDIQEGKVTLLASFAFEHADVKQKENLKQLYGKEDLTEKEADQIREMFKKTGALDFARQTALEYTSSALEKINTLPIDQKWKEILKELTDFLTNRNK